MFLTIHSDCHNSLALTHNTWSNKMRYIVPTYFILQYHVEHSYMFFLCKSYCAFSYNYYINQQPISPIFNGQAFILPGLHDTS
jgi:hypothetical protein